MNSSTAPIICEREDWKKFRDKNEIAQRAGVPISKLPTVVCKEVADNALDAGGIRDYGRTEDDGFYVEDTGPGLAPEQLPIIFSVRRNLMSSKFIRLPARGAAGNGLRIVTGAVLAYKGKLAVSTQGHTYALTPDYNTGETSIEKLGPYPHDGMRVEVNLNGAGPLDLAWIGRARKLAQGDPYKGRSSPHWYNESAFWELADSVQDKTISIREFVSRFDGCSGKKAGWITDELKGRKLSTLQKEEIPRLLAGMQAVSKTVKLARLGCVGKHGDLPKHHAIKRALVNINGAIIPVVVEVWAEPIIEKEEERYALFHVNRSPAIGHVSISDVYGSDRRRRLFVGGKYIDFTVGKYEIGFWINVITPYMPTVSEGKEPSLEFMGNVLGKALNAAANQIKKEYPAEKKKQKRQPVRFREDLSSQKAVIYEYMNWAVAIVSENGKYPYSARQLFYVLRPKIMEEAKIKKPDRLWSNFDNVLGEYQEEHGSLPGLFREPRGSIYDPHTGRTTPLGTLQVKDYKRPEWTFNKILYCEKEGGLFEILKQEKWPEKHDCALFSAKGQATNAAIDLIRKLKRHGEKIEVLLVHDADISGTQIYDVFARKCGDSINVINLGLDPREALSEEMGLEAEKVHYKKDQGPVPRYIYEQEPESIQWLANKRIELNAMLPAKFLEWLSRKFEEKSKLAKVIPPYAIMYNRFSLDLEQRLRERIIELLDMRAMIRGIRDSLADGIEDKSADLKDYVKKHLKKTPVDLWEKPVHILANKAANKADIPEVVKKEDEE